MLEHCRKEKPNVDSPFVGTFPSDRIPKAKKDLSIHFFIDSFTPRAELGSQKELPLPQSTLNFLLRDGGDDFHSKESHLVCGSDK